MSDAPNDELRQELAAIVDETRRHLQWMSDAGVRTLKRETDGSAPASAFEQPPRPTFSDGGRSRPNFLNEPPKPPPAAPLPKVVAPEPPKVVRPPPEVPPLEPPKVIRPAPEPIAPVATRTEPPPVHYEPPPPVAQAPVTRPMAPLIKPVQMSTAAFPEAQAKDKLSALRIIKQDLGNCTRCQLSSTRNTIVFGQGNPEAELLFVGEAPGEDEDNSGLPFVGKAGQLLTRMIEAMGYTRDDVYICNVIKCRPPGNRKPEPPEVEQCRPFVERQILAIKPKVIVALGATAAQSLLRTNVGIMKLRNQWHEWQGIPVMPTFHPSYLLRAPDEKGKAWDDLKLVLARLGRQPPGRR